MVLKVNKVEPVIFVGPWLDNKENNIIFNYSIVAVFNIYNILARIHYEIFVIHGQPYGSSFYLKMS